MTDTLGTEKVLFCLGVFYSRIVLSAYVPFETDFVHLYQSDCPSFRSSLYQTFQCNTSRFEEAYRFLKGDLSILHLEEKRGLKLGDGWCSACRFEGLPKD